MTFPENSGKNRKLLKLLVDIEVDKPVLRVTKLNLGEETIWIDFKYEMLPTFCFYCGVIRGC